MSYQSYIWLLVWLKLNVMFFIFGLLLFSSFVFSGPNHFFLVEIVKCSLECLTLYDPGGGL